MDRCRTWLYLLSKCVFLLIPIRRLLLLQATDTTSTTLVRIVHQLALHPAAQARLRQELTEATAGVGRALRDLDFEAYAGLPYMGAVIRETVRM